MQNNLALIDKHFKKIYKPTNNNLRTSSNSKNKNLDMTPRYKNEDHSGQFGTQRTVNVAGTREKEVPTADSSTDSEPVEQVQNDAGNNVFANVLQHSEQSESVSNTCLVETNDSNVIPDSPDMCKDDIQNNQNDVESDDKRVTLANLITNLKLDVDENKKTQKQLNKANTTLAQELKECKAILAETNGKPVTCSECEGMLRGGFCLPCNLKAEKLFIRDPNAYSFNNSNYLSQPQCENYLCNLCENNSHNGYDCQQQFPLVYEQEPSYNQNYNEVCEEQKQNMENTILELVEICRQKELYCMHDNVDNLIESALNSKLLSINLNSQSLDKKKQEVKNVVEQPAERRTHIEKSLQNFRVIHKSPISLKNTSQISPVYAIAPILSTKEPEYSLKDKREGDVLVCENSPICDDHSEIYSDSNNDDDISSDDNAFEDIEYVEASLPNLEIVSLEEENDVHQEEEEFDLEDIQDIVLREKLLSINCLIANIESLNDKPTPDCMLNSSASNPNFEESNNSLFISDNSSPEFETFCDHTEETRSGSTVTHADNSLPEYDSFCFEIEPDQEKLTSAVMNDISNNSINDPLLEEVNLFLASDNSIPPGIENFGYHSEGDIRFLEELLSDDSILFPNNESFDFEDDPSFPRPLPEPPDHEFDLEPEVISAVMNNIDELNEDKCFDPGGKINVSTNDEDVDYFPFIFVIRIFLPYLIYPEISPLFLSAESEDTILTLVSLFRAGGISLG
nr:hypothetical protein [Tanacetum cinerariifolium]